MAVLDVVLELFLEALRRIVGLVDRAAALVTDMAAELRGVDAVEEDRAPAALGVADLSHEDGGVSALGPALVGEEFVADPLDQEPLDRLGRAGVLQVAGGVLARRDGL